MAAKNFYGQAILVSLMSGLGMMDNPGDHKDARGVLCDGFPRTAAQQKHSITSYR